MRIKFNFIFSYGPCIFSAAIRLFSSNYFLFSRLYLVFFFSKAKIAPLKKSQKITRRRNGKVFHSKFIKHSSCKSKVLADYWSIFDLIDGNFFVYIFGPKILEKTFRDFFTFSTISFHHEWIGTRLLSLQSEYMSCLTSCWTT